MILRPEQLKMMAQGLPATPANFGGGGGKSESSNQTTTTNADQRLNVSSGVGATASSGGTVQLNVTQLDDGAVSQAFGMGESALQGLLQMGTASMSASSHTAEDAISGILASAQGAQQSYADASNKAIAAAQDAYSSAASQVTAAYQDSKTGNQRVIVIGALIVVGVVAAMPFLMAEAK